MAIIRIYFNNISDILAIFPHEKETKTKKKTNRQTKQKENNSNNNKKKKREENRLVSV